LIIFRLFHLQNDEIEEVELAGFDFQHQTLFCANVISDQYLQVEQIKTLSSFFEYLIELDYNTFNSFDW
jgi:hypothetical protein